jgi:glycine/D-amino acid oxidase-like deaminating enzyme
MRMSLKEKVYWQETVDMPAVGALNPIPTKVDLAVIGGGIPGLAAAIQLARRGVTVAVLEAETIGWGASSRNSGMALTGLKLDAQVVEARYGHDLAHQLFKDSLASLATVEQIIAQEHIECSFARTGHLMVASKPAHYSVRATFQSPNSLDPEGRASQ